MSGIKPPDKVRIEKLENGLTVILQELRYSPVAAVCLVYRAGSLWETPQTRGLSHFCEHMMFKGSAKFGPGTYWKMVQRNGGLANAYTSRDITVYYSTVPKAGRIEIAPPVPQFMAVSRPFALLRTNRLCAIVIGV